MGGQAIRNKEVMKLFGERVREVRKSKGITQEELADRVGTTQAQIGRIETGNLNTTVSTIVSISKALGIPTSELFEGVDF